MAPMSTDFIDAQRMQHELAKLSTQDRVKIGRLLALLEKSSIDLTPDELIQARLAAGLSKAQACAMLGIERCGLHEVETLGLRRSGRGLMSHRMDDVYGLDTVNRKRGDH